MRVFAVTICNNNIQDFAGRIHIIPPLYYIVLHITPRRWFKIYRYIAGRETILQTKEDPAIYIYCRCNRNIGTFQGYRKYISIPLKSPHILQSLKKYHELFKNSHTYIDSSQIYYRNRSGEFLYDVRLPQLHPISQIQNVPSFRRFFFCDLL